MNYNWTKDVLDFHYKILKEFGIKNPENLSLNKLKTLKSSIYNLEATKRLIELNKKEVK